MIYLDTHVILWLFARKGEGLSVRAMKLIAQAAIGSNALITKDQGIRRHYQYAVW